MTEYGQRELPSWLFYDDRDSSLKGLPSLTDKGTYVIDFDGDLFTITVKIYETKAVAEPSNSDSTPHTCSKKESVTEVRVILNQDLDTTAGLDKYQLVTSLGLHLELKSDHIRFVSGSSKAHDIPDTLSTLITGPADGRKELSGPQTGSYFSWIVGCGAVKAHQMEVLERLEALAQDGSLSDRLGYGVAGWQVTIKKPEIITNRRLKRQYRATSTPVPSAVTPGKQGLDMKLCDDSKLLFIKLIKNKSLSLIIAILQVPKLSSSGLGIRGLTDMALIESYSFSFRRKTQFLSL